MKKSKLERRLKKLEFDLRDQIWEATNPPLFKHGDKVKWFENPCWTGAPDDAPKPIKVTIEGYPSIIKGELQVDFDEEGERIYYQHPPYRVYRALTKDGKMVEVMEHNCNKI